MRTFYTISIQREQVHQDFNMSKVNALAAKYPETHQFVQMVAHNAFTITILMAYDPEEAITKVEQL